MSSQANTPARKAPFGSWESPISAADVAGGSHPVQTGRYVRDQIWWSELRSSEGGRYSVRTTGANGEPVDILPAPWNARSRVHEYGGGAWTTTPTGSLVFVEFSDQRIYLLDERSEPKPLTPPSAGVNFGELSVRGDSVLAIQETYVGAQLTRHIVSIPLDGSASDDPQKLTEIVSGSDFLAYPRVSPDGKQLAWIAWNHPQMPWDGTELRIGSLNGSGQIDEYRTLIGADDESVLQPAWLDNETLLVISDRTGWWNLYEIGTDGEIQPALELESDIGGPLWNVGTTWYSPLDDGRVLFVAAHGADTLGILDLASKSHSWIENRFTTIALGAVSGTTVLLEVGSAQEAGGLRELDLISGEFRDVRLDVDTLPDLEYLPVAEERTFVRERDVHAIVYPPRNPGFVGLDGELPPYVAFVHGGPTAQTHASVNLAFAYYTSRGIGVIDVNYGGSTGYGREYRNRLRGQWGIVDVEDTVAAVLGLADAGLADPKRLAIEGGSAGGWTVLSALTQTDVFAAGVSLYGVAELKEFAAETHDFESRYVDGLIGPLPEAADLYDERAPLNHVDELSCPVLLLQGLDDKIVPPAQSERFRDALLAQGIPHAYIAFEGESHGFRKFETRVAAREASLSFYGQVLGFTPPGVPVLELWRPTV